MKCAFIWDWDNEFQQLLTWEDGLAKALQLLSKKIDIDLYTQSKIPERTIVYHPYYPFIVHSDWTSMAREITEKEYDVYLFFADMTRPALNELAGHKPSALCFTGGFAESSAMYDLKLIFAESEVWVDKFRRIGLKAIQAFGTNTELFKPIQQVKVWDAIFPATFADWKRHNLFAEALKEKGLATGWFQPHEPWCYEKCFENDVLVLPHTPAYVLPYLYAASHTCVITSNAAGGSQRTVLEAMACDIPVIVMDDSDKTSEFVKESGAGYVVKPEVGAIQEAVQRAKKEKLPSGRSYILSKWTEKHYADTLEEGLKSII